MDNTFDKYQSQWYTFEELCVMLGKAMANGWYLNALFIHQELRSRLSEAQFGS